VPTERVLGTISAVAGGELYATQLALQKSHLICFFAVQITTLLIALND
jgi:hypothetical protein